MGDDEIPTELIAGKYQLTRLLGRGGMGSVWEGVHSSLGTRVACKFIEAEYADSAEARSRFENEARAAASLRSKHVVEVYDHGVTNDGRPYIVMEFLAGEPLDARLTRVGRLSLPDTAHVITHVARALAKAHEAGIVHRDLKPENVFLVHDDEDHADIAKVVDFGIAKFTDKSVGISSATRTGSVLGTPYYMSPEQARGLRTVDYRSDLWSLGVIAFRCVVGRLPFEGEALGDLLVKLCTAPIPIPSQLFPGLPHEFDVWMARALSREPEARFSDARGMAQELSQVAGVAPRARLSSGYDAETSGQMAALGTATPQRFSASSGGTTPMPLSAGTPYPQAPASMARVSAAGSTNGALTATPPLEMRKSKAPMLAAVAASVVVLGIGVVVLAQSLSGDPTEPVASSSSAVEPGVDEAPVAAAPAVEPVDEAEPEAADVTAEPAASEKAPAAAKRKLITPAKKPAQPAIVAAAPPAPTPVEAAEPKPVEKAPPPPKPAPKPRAATPRKKPGIDVGY